MNSSIHTSRRIGLAAIVACGWLAFAEPLRPSLAVEPAQGPTTTAAFQGQRSGRRARRPRHGSAEASTRLGRYAQRPGPARIHRARAGDHRAAWIRVGHVGHAHPHRLERHCEEPQENRRQPGERRTESEQRGRDLLCRPPRRPARCLAERRAPPVRARRAWVRGGAHRPDRLRVVAGVRRLDWGALRRAPDYWGRDHHQREPDISRNQTLPARVRLQRRVLSAESVLPRKDRRPAAIGCEAG